MPRSARAVVPGIPHHVTQRGNRLLHLGRQRRRRSSSDRTSAQAVPLARRHSWTGWSACCVTCSSLRSAALSAHEPVYLTPGYGADSAHPAKNRSRRLDKPTLMGVPRSDAIAYPPAELYCGWAGHHAQIDGLPIATLNNSCVRQITSRPPPCRLRGGAEWPALGR